MILLDTNVVTALISPRIAPNVARFADRHPLSELFLPSIVIAEIRYGLRRLPNGRRQLLEEQFVAFLAQGFVDRVLVFDAGCADGYAVARITREQAGRSLCKMPLSAAWRPLTEQRSRCATSPISRATALPWSTPGRG